MKYEVISNLFEGSEIRSVWDDEQEDYYFSVADVVRTLTKSNIPRNYWSDLKRKLKLEGSQLHENIVQLKMKAQDGKYRNTEEIFRLLESIPSPRAELFKMWLASLGKERIDEVFDPELAIKRAVSYYRKKGYSNEWIESRLKGIISRNKLTDVWYSGGIKEEYEYAMLTNEIYKSWSGMTASQYKELKDIGKESLRDNMTDIEILLTDLGELTTRDIARGENPQGLKENLNVAKRGGYASKIAKDYYEKETKSKVITSKNAIGYRHKN